MKNGRTYGMVLLAVLGAWAYILRLFDFSVLPSAPFLKVDLSDLLVLVGLLIKGPIGAVTVACIRDILNYLVKGGEMGIPLGALMSILASMAFYLPVDWALKRLPKRLFTYIVASALATCSMVVILSVVNYFIALPLYIQILKFPIPSISQYVVTLIVPFNLIKGALIGFCQVILLPVLTDFLAKKRRLWPAYQLLDVKGQVPQQFSVGQS